MDDKAHEREIVIEPRAGSGRVDLGEIYGYRHMLWSMVWKDIRLQYDEVYFGFFWAVSRPVVMVAIFALIQRFSSADMGVTIPYSLYVYSGIILWYYFLEAIVGTSRSVTRDADLIKKVYFPRLISPMVPVISGLYTLALSLVPLVIMMAWLGVYPDLKLALLPAVLLQAVMLSMGVGSIFAVLSISTRDYEKFLNLALYAGMFVSPVIFAPDMIPEKGRVIYFLNPMAGSLLAFRSCLFAEFPFPVWQWAYSVAFSVAALLFGTRIYGKAEAYFADRL
jgi:lipopolysaccharide transport system permease protein